MYTNKKTRLLIVDDDAPLRESLGLILPPELYAVTEAGSLQEAREALKGEDIDMILLDIDLPDGSGLDFLLEIGGRYANRVIMLTGQGSVQGAVASFKTGAFDFLQKPVDPDLLLASLEKAVYLFRQLTGFHTLQKAIANRCTFDNIITRSRCMEKTIGVAEKLAATDNSILITGETGTGKELVAQAVHMASRRREQAFISINCASIPLELAEPELFGYMKGAFTGAADHYPGRFLLADKGTLFLDEIAELPLALQGKLLRVLESGEITPLKGTSPLRVDVRVIAATNKNILKEVRKGNFRQDLYYRIEESLLRVPPLRERKRDIAVLAQHFIRIANIAGSKHISGLAPETLRMLTTYHWPGNVRELKNTVKKIAAQMKGGIIQPFHLTATIRDNSVQSLNKRPELLLKSVEKQHILKVLRLTGRNYKQSARALGISRATLYRKLNEYDAERAAV